MEQIDFRLLIGALAVLLAGATKGISGIGLPVVATNVSGLPEFLEDGRTGLSVSPKDPLAFADAMEKLLKDEALRRAVSQAARKRIEQNFNNKTLIRDLARIYSQMIPDLEISPDKI